MVEKPVATLEPRGAEPHPQLAVFAKRRSVGLAQQCRREDRVFAIAKTVNGIVRVLLKNAPIAAGGLTQVKHTFGHSACGATVPKLKRAFFVRDHWRENVRVVKFATLAERDDLFFRVALPFLLGIQPWLDLSRWSGRN